MLPDAIKAMSWPFRFLLIILMKSALCVGFSFAIARTIEGQGSLILSIAAVTALSLLLGYSYIDGDKRFLQVSGRATASKSLKNLLVPGLLAAFSYTTISSSMNLLAINHVQSVSIGLYLFMVILLLNGPILCIAMETLCASEGYVFQSRAMTFICGLFFLVGILAMSVNGKNNWQLSVLILTSLFLLSAMCMQIRAIFKKPKDSVSTVC